MFTSLNKYICSNYILYLPIYSLTSKGSVELILTPSGKLSVKLESIKYITKDIVDL